MLNKNFISFTVLLLMCVSGSQSATCITSRTYNSWNHYYYTYSQCADGCCGSAYTQYCCSPPVSKITVTSELKAVEVLGGVGGSFVVVLVLVKLFHFIKKKNKSQQVVQPTARYIFVREATRNQSIMGKLQPPACNCGAIIPPPPYSPYWSKQTQTHNYYDNVHM